MEYNFGEIEKKWQQWWRDNHTYAVSNDSSRPKHYVLDMFPYPSGAGLHVGHPLGYIASDIYARYKRLKGFNVLHPMGYDAFGLPAEQYAIETGQHPAVTTEKNIARYREQLDKIGFSFDWSRQVKTSDPDYYKWTQWIFLQIFHSWYDRVAGKARPLAELIDTFEKDGNRTHPAPGNDTLNFTAEEWVDKSGAAQREILMQYRLAYLDYAEVWWCEALQTVLANDEVINGVSERGGHPCERRKMRQWALRITEYADRLLAGLDTLDWTDAMKEMQRNWIGRSVGAEVEFEINRPPSAAGSKESAVEAWPSIKVFTTRPDTIFGVDFMVLAPELDLVKVITTEAQKEEVEKYSGYVKSRSERERLSEVKQVTGAFTGAYAKHPFTGMPLPIWISEYVLAGYGTGAIMGVPSGDERDHAFAKHFNIPVTNIFGDAYTGKAAYSEKTATLSNSDFLNGLSVTDALPKAIGAIESKGIGKARINYRLRDAGFSRQRYWGEPFPVVYVDGVPYGTDEFEASEETALPIELPMVETYSPGPEGQGPLANIQEWVRLGAGGPDLTPGPSPSRERGDIRPTSPPTPLHKVERGDIRPGLSEFTSGSSGADLTPGPSPSRERGDIRPGLSEKSAQRYPPIPKYSVERAKQFEHARQNRKFSTDAEDLLWQSLRDSKISSCKFRRQHPIGTYVTDFICLQRRLIVEVDGGYHGDADQQEYDKDRTWSLKQLGFEVIRFNNDQVLKTLSAVLQQIRDKLKEQLTNISQHKIDDYQNESAPSGANVSPLHFWRGAGGEVLRETNTMPGYAGSSWYFLRYADPHNDVEFVSKKATDYWGQVDVYVGGTEHAVGHLLYSRMWTKVLHDLGHIGFDEPFKKLVNQGMIQGSSRFVYADRFKKTFYTWSSAVAWIENGHALDKVRVDVNLVDGLDLDLTGFKKWRPEFNDWEFVSEIDSPLFVCGSEVEKMSKSKYNVVNPDDIVAKYGADTFRMYEMFLGPIEVSKPWDTQGIEGVHRFLKKLWRLCFDEQAGWRITDDAPSEAVLRILHKTIKKVGEDIERFGFNTAVSAFMICVNELTAANAAQRTVIGPLAIILAPFAPHMAEEIWKGLGNATSVLEAAWPEADSQYTTDNTKKYGVAVNGKTRIEMEFPLDAAQDAVQERVLAEPVIQKWMEDKPMKKFIYVKGKMINVVV